MPPADPRRRAFALTRMAWAAWREAGADGWVMSEATRLIAAAWRRDAAHVRWEAERMVTAGHISQADADSLIGEVS